MYKTNQMLLQEVEDLKQKVTQLTAVIDSHKYDEANNQLKVVSAEAKVRVLEAQKESELYQKWIIEKHCKSLEKEVEFLRTLINQQYDHRRSNEPSLEITEPNPR